MRSKDTALIQRIKKRIEQTYESCGRFPSIREIAAGVGCCYSTVSRYLNEMIDRGIITREGGEYETEAIAKMNIDTVSVAVVGSVSCGPLTFAEENIEEYIKLPTSLLGGRKVLHSSRERTIHDRSRDRRRGPCRCSATGDGRVRTDCCRFGGRRSDVETIFPRPAERLYSLAPGE